MANRKPIVLATAGTLEQIPNTDSIIVLSAAFIANAILIPAANGALQFSSTGNTRGTYAVDLQASRAAVTQVASGNYSVIVGGYDNTVSGVASHVGGGRSNTIVGDYGVVGGGYTNSIPVSTGDYNTIVGGYSNAIVAASVYNGSNVLGGYANSIQGKYCVIAGGYSSDITFASGAQYNTISGGYNHDMTSQYYSTIGGGTTNKMSSSYSTICGGTTNTINCSYGCIGGGSSNTIPVNCGDYNTITGGYSNTTVVGATYNGWNVISGYDNSIQGQYCVIAGGYTNSISVAAGSVGSVISGGDSNTISTGNRNTICGGLSNTVVANSGDYNIILAGYSNTTVAGATNNGKNILGGYDNSVQGEYCVVVGGWLNTITVAAGAQYSTLIGGYSNSITAGYATIVGGFGNEVTSSGTAIGGYYGKASQYGQIAQASGRFAATGDAQTSVSVLRCQTTDANATEMFLNGSSIRLVIPVNTSWLYTAKVIGRQTNGDYSVGVYHNEGVITRDAANCSLVNNTPIYTNEQDANWALAITADTTNQALKLAVTGVAANNINWVARVELVEVTG